MKTKRKIYLETYKSKKKKKKFLSSWRRVEVKLLVKVEPWEKRGKLLLPAEKTV